VGVVILRAESAVFAGSLDGCLMEAIAGSGDREAVARSGGDQVGPCRAALHLRI
jgi:hypothetical protein